MRRKPDIKYHKTANDFQNLPKIQLEILESVAPTLKQWGIMSIALVLLRQKKIRK